MNEKKGSVLIVGAGFIGVEWATEIKYFFPDIEVTICDMLPKCLGPLPESAKSYCQRYMDAANITNSRFSTYKRAMDSEFGVLSHARAHRLRECFRLSLLSQRQTAAYSPLRRALDGLATRIRALPDLMWNDVTGLGLLRKRTGS